MLLPTILIIILSANMNSILIKNCIVRFIKFSLSSHVIQCEKLGDFAKTILIFAKYFLVIPIRFEKLDTWWNAIIGLIQFLQKKITNWINCLFLPMVLIANSPGSENLRNRGLIVANRLDTQGSWCRKM